jgi:hypothetical protein
MRNEKTAHTQARQRGCTGIRTHDAGHAHARLEDAVGGCGRDERRYAQRRDLRAQDGAAGRSTRRQAEAAAWPHHHGRRGALAAQAARAHDGVAQAGALQLCGAKKEGKTRQGMEWAIYGRQCALRASFWRTFFAQFFEGEHAPRQVEREEEVVCADGGDEHKVLHAAAR